MGNWTVKRSVTKLINSFHNNPTQSCFEKEACRSGMGNFGPGGPQICNV